MPIYAYKCSACGHADDVLQKISADALTVCPACGQSTYSKQVTAPQFQLKGSGWYVTDFRGGNGAAKDSGKDSADKSDAKPAADAKTETKPAETAAACPVHATAPAAPAASSVSSPAPKAATPE
jgi:putative FmdB family regulatory protein